RRLDHEAVAICRRGCDVHRQGLANGTWKRQIAGGVGAQRHGKRRWCVIGVAERRDRQHIAAVAVADRDGAGGSAIDVDRDHACSRDASRIAKVDHATAKLDGREAHRLATRDLLAALAIVAARLRGRITSLVAIAAAPDEQHWNRQMRESLHGGSVLAWRSTVAETMHRDACLRSTCTTASEHDATRDHLPRGENLALERQVYVKR